MAPPTNAPWFAGSLRYWQLYLAALDGAGDDLVEQLTEAWERTRAWRHRRDLGRLLCDVLEARGDYVGALELALKVDEVERDAGAETVPARIACLLARTGRLAEAAEAVATYIVEERELVRYPLRRRQSV